MLSLTVFWINALVRSYSLYRILVTIFLYLVLLSIIMFSFIYIFFKYLKYFIQSL